MNMDDLSINYFRDLEFVCHGERTVEYTRCIREDFKDYWGIQFSRRGRFFLKIGDQQPEYADGATVFLSFPGVRFEYGAADASGIENKLYVCFRGERARRFLDGGLMKERRRPALLSPANPDGFLSRLRRLRTLLLLPNDSVNHARAVLELESLLLDVNREDRRVDRQNNVHYSGFAALAERIAAAPEQAWDFPREARKLSVSFAHFRRLFEQFFGTPPLAFLLTARLDKAAELLTESALPVREIARVCGFADEFYFSRAFKKRMGTAPKFYRQRFGNG